MLRFGKKSRSRLSAPVPGLPDVLPYIPPTPSGHCLQCTFLPQSPDTSSLRSAFPPRMFAWLCSGVPSQRCPPTHQRCLPSSSFVLFLAPSVRIRLTYLSSRSWLFSCTVRRVPGAEWPCLACSLLGDRPAQCGPALSGAAHLCCCGCLRSPNHFCLPLLSLDCIYHILYPGHPPCLFSGTPYYPGSLAPSPATLSAFCQVRAWFSLSPQHPLSPQQGCADPSLACPSCCVSLALRPRPPSPVGTGHALPPLSLGLLAALLITSPFLKTLASGSQASCPLHLLSSQERKDGRKERANVFLSAYCAPGTALPQAGHPGPSAGSVWPRTQGNCPSSSGQHLLLRG